MPGMSRHISIITSKSFKRRLIPSIVGNDDGGKMFTPGKIPLKYLTS
jgi:hypothetical protein